MLVRFPGILAGLLLLLGSVGAGAASNHAPATRLGDVDVSLFCPAGSSWSPFDGGVCLGCPDNKKPKVGLCPGMREARTARAVYSHERKRWSPICRIGTFKRRGTRECWTCPKGFVRMPGVKFNRQGICFSPPHPIATKPKVVERIALKDVLNPRRLGDQARDLGCKGYDRDAVFSPVAGGTCWVCPESHPKRTLNPVFSARACGTAACGGLGERPCNVLAGEGRPCTKGLRHNPFTQQCVAKKPLACKPMIAAVQAVTRAIDRANEVGDGLRGKAMDSVPGMRTLMALVDKSVQTLEGEMAGLVSKLPIDRITSDIDLMLKSPEELRAMQAVLQAVIDSRDVIWRMMLEPDIACDDPQAIGDLVIRRLNETWRAEAGGKHFAHAMDKLGLVSPAHAARSERQLQIRPLRGKAFSMTAAASLFLKQGGLKLPVGFAIEYFFSFNAAGTPHIAVNLIAGLDFPSGSDWEESGATAFFVSFAPDVPQRCAPPPIAMQLELGSLVGISGNWCGLTAVNVNLGGSEHRQTKVTEFFTADAPRRLLALLPEMQQKSSTMGEDWNYRPPGPQKSFVVGINGMKHWFTLIGDPDAPERSAMAP